MQFAWDISAIPSNKTALFGLFPFAGGPVMQYVLVTPVVRAVAALGG
jgi:hypothetical protein